MQHAISPVAADTARYLTAIDNQDRCQAEIDRRSDAIRDELEAGDWEYLEQLVANGPTPQREAFWRDALRKLLPTGADLMRGPLQGLAAPLQECVSIGIDERVRREIKRDVEQAEEQLARACACR